MKNLLKQMRDADFRAASKRVMRRIGPQGASLAELAALTLQEPAPGFYIGVDHALKLLSAGYEPKPGGLKAEMLGELRRRVEAMARRHPGESTVRTVSRVLCDSSAPRFYMGLDSALRILRRQPND